VHWVLLDLALYALGVLLVGAIAFLLYKRVRVLMRAVGAATDQVSEYTPQLQVNTPPKR
jgi:hypothetical protein